MKGVLAGFGGGAVLGAIGVLAVMTLVPPVPETAVRPAAPEAEPSVGPDVFGTDQLMRDRRVPEAEQPVATIDEAVTEADPAAEIAEPPVETYRETVPPVPDVAAPAGPEREPSAPDVAALSAPETESLAPDVTAPSAPETVPPAPGVMADGPALSQGAPDTSTVPLGDGARDADIPATTQIAALKPPTGQDKPTGLTPPPVQKPAADDTPAARLSEADGDRPDAATLADASPAPGPEPVSAASTTAPSALGTAPEPSSAPRMDGWPVAQVPSALAIATLRVPRDWARPALADGPVPQVKPEPVPANATTAPAPPAAPTVNEVAVTIPFDRASDERPAWTIPSAMTLPAQATMPILAAAPVSPAPEPAQPEEPEGPALDRNAVPAGNTGGRPLMAVVLLDRDGGALLQTLPLSVAIAADATDAAARAQVWRDAGQEVVAIPAVTDPSDTGADALIDGTASAVPQAASVMPDGEGGFAGGPLVSRRIVEILAETGHGLIARGSALDPAIRAAEQAGVPVTRIYRRMDGSGRDARAIARFLDQAAFEARNRGSVVVLAANTDEVARAFDLWLGSSRAQSVALVPVSAVLRQGESEGG